MRLVIVGTHQRVAPVAVRECLAFDPANSSGALEALRHYVAEGFVLSTCNRVEVYGLGAGAEPPDRALRRFLADWHHLPLEELTPHLYTFADADAVRHIFRLSAGLDSMVLGEDQIMGQLKGAFAAAHRAGATGQVLNRLLHGALAAGKLVRTRTGIARSHLSVVSVALDLASDTLGGLAGRRFLIVGAGRTAELALKHLRAVAAGSITIANRTPERAQELAQRYGARARPLDQLEQALGEAEIVIGCTAAPEIVIDADLVARMMNGRSQELLLLDLAVPRDIDRHVAALPGVRLFDVDDMQAICAENRAARAAEIVAAETLIEGEVTKFMEWWAAQQVVPTIRALREHAEAIRQAELERALAKLPGLSPRQQEALQALSAAIVNKLLHQPTVALKDPARGAALAEALAELFQLSDRAVDS